MAKITISPEKSALGRTLRTRIRNGNYILLYTFIGFSHVDARRTLAAFGRVYKSDPFLNPLLEGDFEHNPQSD